MDDSSFTKVPINTCHDSTWTSDFIVDWFYGAYDIHTGALWYCIVFDCSIFFTIAAYNLWKCFSVWNLNDEGGNKILVLKSWKNSRSNEDILVCLGNLCFYEILEEKKKLLVNHSSLCYRQLLWMSVQCNVWGEWYPNTLDSVHKSRSLASNTSSCYC